MTKPINAVLFDLDGTLLDITLDFSRMKQAVTELIRCQGIYEDRMVSMNILELVDEAAQILEQRESQDGVRLRAAAEEILSTMEIEAGDKAVAASGALSLITDLHTAGIPTAIVTRNCRLAVDRSLGRLHFPVDVVLTRNDVPHPKPDPDHLRRAMERIGAKAPHTLMVGDHWMDIQAGKAAGCQTAGILTSGKPEDWFAPCPPDYLIHSLSEVIHIVDKNASR